MLSVRFGLAPSASAFRMPWIFNSLTARSKAKSAAVGTGRASPQFNATNSGSDSSIRSALISFQSNFNLSSETVGNPCWRISPTICPNRSLVISSTFRTTVKRRQPSLIESFEASPLIWLAVNPSQLQGSLNQASLTSKFCSVITYHIFEEIKLVLNAFASDSKQIRLSPIRSPSIKWWASKSG